MAINKTQDYFKKTTKEPTARDDAAGLKNADKNKKSGDSGKKEKTGYPVSVYLDEETRAYIDQIIEWTKNTPKVRPQTRHAVIQYAVRKLCREWEQGIHPDINILGDFK